MESNNWMFILFIINGLYNACFGSFYNIFNKSRDIKVKSIIKAVPSSESRADIESIRIKASARERRGISTFKDFSRLYIKYSILIITSWVFLLFKTFFKIVLKAYYKWRWRESNSRPYQTRVLMTTCLESPKLFDPVEDSPTIDRKRYS